MITFSDATGLTRFAPFSFSIDELQGLEQFTMRSRRVYAMSITGPAAKAAETKLYAIESLDTRANDPVWNMAKQADAVATTQGELVKIELTLYDNTPAGEDVSASGIITNVVYTGSQNAKQQRLDFLLSVCHTLTVDPIGANTKLTVAGLESQGGAE